MGSGKVNQGIHVTSAVMYAQDDDSITCHVLKIYPLSADLELHQELTKFLRDQVAKFFDADLTNITDLTKAH